MGTLTVRFERFIKNYLKKLGIGLIINFAIVFALCYFTNKTQFQSYINCIFYVGGANLALGIGSIFGNGKMRGNLGYQYSRVSSSESQVQCIQDDIESLDKAFSFTTFMGILGGSLMLISAILQALI